MKTYCYLDFGNSRVKAWICFGNTVIDRFSYTHRLDVDSFFLELPQSFQSDVREVVVASVLDTPTNQRFVEIARQYWGLDPIFVVSSATHGLLRNGYVDPGRLGVDRWLNALAVADRECCCVVSCGTALTLDLVSDHQHQGGYILPGYHLQLHALIHGTQKVRPTSIVETLSLTPGCTTEDAVHRGVLLGMLGAIERTVSDFKARNGRQCSLVLTGGDADKLAPHLAIPHDIIPELILLGLQRYTGRVESERC